MSWRNRLQPASYCGVEFLVDGRELAGQHAHAKHRFVGRDGAYYEPISEDAEQFTVDAFVLGDEYMDARDALLLALKRNPVGEYADPFTGLRLWVAVLQWSVAEGVSEGLGYARFTLTLSESAQDPNRPEVYQQASTAVAAKAVSWADSIAASQYAKDFAAIADFAEGVAGALSEAADQVQAVENAVFGPLSGVVTSLQETASAIATLRDSLSSLITAPEQLWEQLSQVATTLGYEALDGLTPTLAVQPALTLADAGEQAAADAARAVSLAFLRSALTAQGQAITAYAWSSSTEALGAKARWAALMLAAGDGLEGQAYASWTDARIQTGLAIDALALALPELLTIDFGAPTSVLELAQAYYQDAGRAQEIIDRNPQILHPGFVTGSITILRPGA